MMTSSAASERSVLFDRFTAPGQPFEIGEQTVNGVPMRVYAKGPQTLREIGLAIGAFGDRPFVIYRDERWTYAGQARIIAGLARCLAREYGLRKGDRVAVCMRNYPEWVPVFWASQVLGLVLVPLNAWWTATELRYALADSGASLVVADAERTALLQAGRLPLIEVRGGGRAWSSVRRWDDLLGSLDPATAPPDVEVRPDDDSTILYTSGTTGQPKGAIGTHRNHCTNVCNTLLSALVNATIRAGGEPPVPGPDAPQTGTLCTFPFFHIAGITSISATPLAGGKLATQYKWDRTEARELIRREPYRYRRGCTGHGVCRQPEPGAAARDHDL